MKILTEIESKESWKTGETEVYVSKTACIGLGLHPPNIHITPHKNTQDTFTCTILSPKTHLLALLDKIFYLKINWTQTYWITE